MKVVQEADDLRDGRLALRALTEPKPRPSSQRPRRAPCRYEPIPTRAPRATSSGGRPTRGSASVEPPSASEAARNTSLAKTRAPSP